MAEEEVTVVSGDVAYVREREADLRKVLYSAGLEPTKIESIPFTLLHDLMAQAWQYGWTTGFGFQGKVEEVMRDGGE